MKVAYTEEERNDSVRIKRGERDKRQTSRNQNLYLDDEEKFSLNIPFGSRIFFEDGENVKANQLLADWDPYTLPIIAEEAGFIKYVDLKQGVSSYLTDRIIEYSFNKKMRYLDFNGCNSPHRADFKHSFGAEPKLYFRINSGLNYV